MSSSRQRQTNLKTLASSTSAFSVFILPLLLLFLPIFLAAPSVRAASFTPGNSRHGDRGGAGRAEDLRREKGRGREKVDPLGDEFGRFVEGLLDEWKVPGLSVAVVDGRETWAEGYGISSFPSTPVTPSTLFYTGSTTKAFTAALVAQMIHPPPPSPDSYSFSTQSSSSSSSSSSRNHHEPKKLLTWQTPLSSLIPGDFVLGPERAWEQTHLTLEDALSHRTGFPRHDKSLASWYPDHEDDDENVGDNNEGEGGEAAGYHNATMRDYTRSLRHLPMVAEPRTQFRYCNLMFMVVSHVIETALTGVGMGRKKRLGDVMRERIWAPLGMRRTYMGVEEALRDGNDGQVAEGYYWDYLGEGEGEDGGGVGGSGGGGAKREKGGFVKVPFMDIKPAGGAGGIVSNVLDYARWIRCLMGDGGNTTSTSTSTDDNDHRPEDQTKTVPAVLTDEARVELTKARIPIPPRSSSSSSGGGGGRGDDGWDAPLQYALGWMLGTYRGHRVYTHGGGMEAYGAEVFWLPDLRYGVVAMANTALTANFACQEVAWRLIDGRLGVPGEERFDWGARYRKLLEQRLKAPDTAIETLFPDRADPPLATRLPLRDYAGTYFHPAYRNLTIEVVNDDDDDSDGKDDALRYAPQRDPYEAEQKVLDYTDKGNSNSRMSSTGSRLRPGSQKRRRPQLRAVRRDMQWQMTYEFEHASGEYWAVVIDMLNSPNRLNGQLARAEFEVGVDGKVAGVGMEFLEDGYEGVVLFEKVA
ncbi:beta-lactamase/transpeptidase-like protein [Xylariomycetidae sp. FL2044]|nr:beta-lactamase/transpeptidase-like protein [Xylariomycetidae sp. FL2044]